VYKTVPRSQPKYRSVELFKVDLQSNLRVYLDNNTWLRVKPKGPLPWDQSDMFSAYRNYLGIVQSGREHLQFESGFGSRGGAL
jgi:hypothetical protein